MPMEWLFNVLMSRILPIFYYKERYQFFDKICGLSFLKIFLFNFSWLNGQITAMARFDIVLLQIC